MEKINSMSYFFRRLLTGNYRMPSTDSSSPGRGVAHNLANSRADSSSDSGLLPRGYLHQMSPFGIAHDKAAGEAFSVIS